MAYKKLSEATLVENISDVANVLIEENDEIKRVPKSELGGVGNAVDVMVDNDYNIIECPLTYDELKGSIENGKPPMITVFMLVCEYNEDGSIFEKRFSTFSAEEFIMHYNTFDEGNYISVRCRGAYYLDFRENGEITFYSVD